MSGASHISSTFGPAVEDSLGAAVSSDTTLLIGREKTVVRLHSAILASQSEYFHRALSSRGNELDFRLKRVTTEETRFQFPKDDVEGWLLVKRYSGLAIQIAY